MAPSNSLERLRVLVVDDNKNMQMLIKTILESFQIRSVEAAEDGRSAFQTLMSFPADIIITDLNMPVVDGVEFVRLVRTDKESRNPYIPIIMLTGHSDLPRIMLARDAGANSFLTKPVSAESLYSKMVSVIEHPQPFIRCGTYVGPDRRRKNHGPPRGVGERRADGTSKRS